MIDILPHTQMHLAPKSKPTQILNVPQLRIHTAKCNFKRIAGGSRNFRPTMEIGRSYVKILPSLPKGNPSVQGPVISVLGLLKIRGHWMGGGNPLALTKMDA